MLIEISIGEGLDRLSILEIKQKEIKDINKQLHITNEIHSLSVLLKDKETYLYYYNLLMDVNTDIWHSTNTIKSMTVHTPEFGILANTIFELNQSRFRLKQIINRLSQSLIQEQKSYEKTYIDIVLTDLEPIDIPTFSKLSLNYDCVRIHCSYEKSLEFEQTVPKFNYMFTHP
ncbi:MAG: DUF6165 family protein [Pseudomonadota bacterium]